MAVLGRKLFNRGGYAHRGTGITSGLDTPKRGYVDGPGSYAGEITKAEALAPWLLDISGKLMSAKSKQGGFSGALDIAGQATSSSAPLLSEGLQRYRKGQEEGERKIIKGADGYQYYADDGTRVLPGVVKAEKEEKPQYTTVNPGESLYKDGELVVERIMPEKDQKLIKLNPNQILIDPSTKEEVARGIEKSDLTVYKLNPGQKVFDKDGKVIAFYEDTDEDIIKLNPGQKAFDKDGNLLFESPATEQEGRIFKLSQGQKAFDASGNEIASVAPKETKPIDTTITVSPGSKVFDKETGTVIFDNPTNAPQEKLYKAQPGTTLIDGEGNVIYEAPEKKQYFKLKQGESIYDQGGNIIASGPSMDDNIDKYHSDKTKDERLLHKLYEYEKKAGFLPNGKIDLSKLTELEQSDYNRALQQVDISAEKGAANWQEYVGENYANINFVVDMEERLAQAERIFQQNEATGPVRGRISPILGVFQDVTGIDIAQVANKVFGSDDVLQRPINARELERLRNEMGVQFQDVMKGQVSNFEQKMILNSFFSVLSLPESNQIAFNNLKYLNDLKRAQIQIAEQSLNSSDFFTKMELWKKENKPEILKDVAEKTADIESKYGIVIAKPVEKD
jgi:hypothetical protein